MSQNAVLPQEIVYPKMLTPTRFSYFATVTSGEGQGGVPPPSRLRIIVKLSGKGQRLALEECLGLVERFSTVGQYLTQLLEI